MRHRGHLKTEERHERSQLSKMLHGKFFVCGTLVTSSRKCGRTGCWCSKGEGGHISTYLSVKVGKKWKMVCVPKDKQKQAKEWVRNYKEICERMIKVSNSCLEKIKGQ